MDTTARDAAPPRHWHEDEHAQPRFTRPFGGVDHGSAGRILAEVRRGNAVHRRLVWFRATRAPAAGVRGFGHVAVPTRLVVIDGGGYHVADVFRAGRLSRERLDDHRAVIDEAMGIPVTQALEIGRTLVAVTDAMEAA